MTAPVINDLNQLKRMKTEELILSKELNVANVAHPSSRHFFLAQRAVQESKTLLVVVY